MSTDQATKLQTAEVDEKSHRKEILRARAVALSQPLASDSQNVVNVLVFDVGKESLGLPASMVREIIKLKKITRIPGAPDHVPGVINLRGEIVSVTDLVPLIGLEPNEARSDKVLIVVDVKDVTTAIRAETVDGIREISYEAIEERANTLDEATAKFFKGLVKQPDKVFSVLHLDAIVGGDES
ncbi:MAG: chemotaxis protein CheW [Terriglobia bacterium]